VSGYRQGPTLPHDEPPWPLGWEQDAHIDDGHGHEWERCLLLAGPGRWRQEHVVRCGVCRAPRCGHSEDDDPCMERRHHDGVHIRLSGAFEPLGGLPDTLIDWGKP
jgi:hypothetical protein